MTGERKQVSGWLDVYECADFFLMRTAALSIEDRERVCRSEDLCKALWDFYRGSEVLQEAIAIASPSLDAALAKGDPKDAPLMRGLLKYFLRATSRATPFGLFASVGWGRFGERVALDGGRVEKRVRPDGALVHAIAEKVHGDRDAVAGLKVVCNPLMSRHGERICLPRWEQEGTKLASIRRTVATDKVFELAGEPVVFADLQGALIRAFPDFEASQAEGFLWQLFSNGFLLSELSVALDGDFELQHGGEEFEGLLDAYQKQGGVEQMRALNRWSEVDHPVAVDAFSRERFELPKELQATVAECGSLLALMAEEGSKSSSVEVYRGKFLEAYGGNRLVPVTELIDEVLGLGPLPEGKKEENGPLRLLEGELARGVEEVDLSGLLDALEEKRGERGRAAPRSMDLFFEVYGDGDETKLALNPMMAADQAGRTFGRFLYLFGEEEQGELRALLEKEEGRAPEVAFVEASFLPLRPRTANVCLFEKTRKHQLKLHYTESETLALDKIYVGSTLDRLYLYSEELEREISVSFSTAINSDLAPPALKLLIAISGQPFSAVSPFVWRSLSSLPGLPRLRYKDVILAPKRWQLTYQFLGLDEGAAKKEVEKRLRAALEELEVPGQVYLIASDNKIPIWRGRPEMFRILLDHFVAKKTATLFEPAFGDVRQRVREIVVPIVKSAKYCAEEGGVRRFPKVMQASLEERIQLPGGEWLYVKLYLPFDNQDRFLIDEVVPFIEKSGIEQWFFIRYSDPRSHLRLRFKGVPKVLCGELLPLLHAWARDLMQRGALADLAIATYERELERYGGPATIEAAEKFFCQDSAYVCERLKEKYDLPKEVMGGLSIIELLQRLVPTDEERLAVLAPMGKQKHLLAGLREPLKLALKMFPETSGEEWNCPRELVDSLIHMRCNRLLGVDRDLELKARAVAYYCMNKRMRHERASSKQQ